MEGQQCQNPELVTLLFQSRISQLDGTAGFGQGSATSLNVGFYTVATYHPWLHFEKGGTVA
jgi:hypothetical protein